MLSDSCGLVVRGCRFESNRAAYYGCALTAVYGGSVWVTDSVFEGNAPFGAPVGNRLGAAGATFRSSATFDRTKFIANAGTSGSAIAAYDSSLVVFNSLLVGNSASGVVNGVAMEGGTIAVRSFAAGNTPLRIVNATITGNSGPANSQAALFAAAGSGSERAIRNSIVWGNSPPAIAGDWIAAASLIEGGFAGTGVFDGNPNFVNAAAGEYTLAAGSPAIDAGDESFLMPAFGFDLAGMARVEGAAPDLGAFEFAAACAGDLNSDGLVDDGDFVLFAGAYNVLDCEDPAMMPSCPADLNADGVVDDADFVLFVAAYDRLVCP